MGSPNASRPPASVDPPNPSTARPARTVGLVAGALAVVGLLAFLLFRPQPAPPKQTSPTGTPPGPAPVLTAGQKAEGRALPPDPKTHYAHDLGPVTPTEPSGPCGARCTCAVSANPCQSNRTCTPGGCTDPMEKKSWRMRLGALKLGNEPSGGLGDDTTVCVKPVGSRDQACTTLKQVRGQGCAAGTGLRVTTDQLTGAGVEIEIRDGQGKVMARAAEASYKFLTDRELCIGVRFGGAKFTGDKPVEMITFWLDEP